jgi:hypothetical protein
MASNPNKRLTPQETGDKDTPSNAFNRKLANGKGGKGMEISSMVLERALEGVNELALPVVGASSLYLMLRWTSPVLGAALAGRPRRRRSRLVRRGASVLGLFLAISSPASAAGRRHPSASAAPRVRTEPGRFPPPRLPGSAGPLVDDGEGSPRLEGPPRVPLRPAPPWEETPRHPAVHGGPVTTSDRLFERRTAGPREEARPAGVPERARWHAVLPGETLWSIAAERLHTDDVRRIARYWPRIHRANRDEIGANPDLIRPGQVLELPPEHA